MNTFITGTGKKSILHFRLEVEDDYRIVEELTREAFWNNFQEGCDEHFLLHKLRSHPDYLPNLSYLAVLKELNDNDEVVKEVIVGSIVYSKSRILSSVTEDTTKLNTITFGPISVHPDYQKHGVGNALIKHTAKLAKEMGYPAIVIYGDPAYYSRFGFRIGEKFDLRTPSNKYAVALQVMALQDNLPIDSFSGYFKESHAFEDLDPEEVAIYDSSFPMKEKKYQPSQTRFQVLVSLSYPVMKPFDWQKEK